MCLDPASLSPGPLGPAPHVLDIPLFTRTRVCHTARHQAYIYIYIYIYIYVILLLSLCLSHSVNTLPFDNESVLFTVFPPTPSASAVPFIHWLIYRLSVPLHSAICAPVSRVRVKWALEINRHRSYACIRCDSYCSWACVWIHLNASEWKKGWSKTTIFFFFFCRWNQCWKGNPVRLILWIHQMFQLSPTAHTISE